MLTQRLLGYRYAQQLVANFCLNELIGFRANYFNYINMTNPDTSGMLRFLTDELQGAEDAGDRGSLISWLEALLLTTVIVWIIGHVLSGWDGSNPLVNPTNLCEHFLCFRGYCKAWHLYSLSDVCVCSCSAPWLTMLIYSVDRFSPHVIASTHLGF